MDSEKTENGDESEFATIGDVVAQIFSEYGWLIFVACILMFLAWQKLKLHWYKWQDDQHVARYHKDPDLALSRMQAMEAARQKLQSQHDKAAAEFARRQAEREEQMRRDRSVRGQEGSGHRNKPKLEDTASVSTRVKTDKPRLRNNDYNPLMGSGSASRYRAARSSFGRAGGGG